MTGIIISIIGGAVCFLAPILIVDLLDERARDRATRDARKRAKQWASPLLDD